VPTTWNNCPRDDTGQLGPAEYTVATAGNLGATVDDQVVNILRILHTWDFCTACAVHLVNADKKKIATIHMETDGTTKVIPAE
jgi:hydrogenase large subunit